MAERFPPPWTVHSNADAYWVEAANGMQFGYCYFRDTQSIGSGQAYLSRDAARRIASNIAKLPELIAGAKQRAGEPEPPHWIDRIGSR